MVLPRPADDDQRLLRDRMAADQQAAYTTRSPALSPFQYSPKTFSISSNPPPSAPSTLQPVFGGQSNRSQPASPSSGPLPSIASGLFQRESTGSKYYDPTSDHRDRGIGRNNGQYHAHLAPQVRVKLLVSLSSRLALLTEQPTLILLSRLENNTTTSTIDPSRETCTTAATVLLSRPTSLLSLHPPSPHIPGLSTEPTDRLSLRDLQPPSPTSARVWPSHRPSAIPGQALKE